MKLKIIDTAHHRNGICGAPFHAVLFHDSGPEGIGGCRMDCRWLPDVFASIDPDPMADRSHESGDRAFAYKAIYK
jgi:hypothetical protein